MISEINKINKVISKKERNRLIWLGIIKFISGLFDLIGVASVAPFILVVTNKEIMERNLLILNLKDKFSINNDEVIILLAALSVLVIMINQLFRMFSTWYTEYVCRHVWFYIHSNLFRYYIDKPFNFHIQTNSNSLLEKVQQRGNAAVEGVINPFFQILGHFFVLIFLSLILLIANPFIALVTLLILSLFYILFYSKIKKKLDSYGKFTPKFYQKTFKLVEQAFKSIKDIKIKQNANYYSNIFDPLAKKYAQNQIRLNFLGSIPRNIIEIIGYSIGFSFIIYLIIAESQKFSDIAVLIGIYAISFQKMLPAMQGVFQQIARYKYFKPSFDIIYEDLIASQKKSEVIKFDKYEGMKPEIFSEKIVFKDVKFKYPNSQTAALGFDNIEIKKGEFIGITGQSGSGKSTFIDLLTGLLHLQKGNFLIDGMNMDSNQRIKLQLNIGYVPQFAFIADDTIKNNIALGVKEEDIKIHRVKKVAEIANISEFIENKLPLGYETEIGEDGVRLSGGQKQRISIARALYNDPKILILDEATNSLDSMTEDKIINSIMGLKNKCTIILVTHRISTLKNSDKILFFDNGILADKGNYEKLTNSNDKFKNLRQKIIQQNINE